MATNLEAWAPQLKCLGDQRAPWKFYAGTHLDLLGLGTPAKMLGALQSCSYWKYDTLHAIFECGSAFFGDISKGNANFSELPHTLNIYGGNIDVSFVLSSKETHLSSSVLVPNRTSPSLLHTFVVDTLLNFTLPFNIPVVLTYTNTSRVHVFGRHIVNN